jgi:type III restriction enzyme
MRPTVPGVNNLGGFGRWQFEEFTDVFEIEAAFGRLVDRVVRHSEVQTV